MLLAGRPVPRRQRRTIPPDPQPACRPQKRRRAGRPHPRHEAYLSRPGSLDGHPGLAAMQEGAILGALPRPGGTGTTCGPGGHDDTPSCDRAGLQPKQLDGLVHGMAYTPWGLTSGCPRAGQRDAPPEVLRFYPPRRSASSASGRRWARRTARWVVAPGSGAGGDAAQGASRCRRCEAFGVPEEAFHLRPRCPWRRAPWPAGARPTTPRPASVEEICALYRRIYDAG